MLNSFIRTAVVRTALRLGTTTRRQVVLRLGNGLRSSNNGEILSYNRQNISIGLNSVHQFQRAYSSDPISMSRHSEWKIPRYIRSTTVLSVHINGQILPLPLPDGDLFEKVKVTWHCYNDQRAPFLNQSSILYDMLEGAFKNWTQSGSRKKVNTACIQAMNPGSGKSRLQIEWIYHVLNNPKIISRFLGSSESVEKKRFINVLYDTAYRQRIILVSGRSVPDTSEDPDYLLVEIIKNNILTRFNGEEIHFDGKTVVIDKASMPEASPVKYAALFNALVDKLTDKPKSLPFSSFEYSIDYAQQLLVFGLDDCHELLRWRRRSKPSESPVYKLLSRSAATNWTKVTPFWVVTGAIIPGSGTPPTHFQPITSSLDNLLHLRCLNTIAKQYFGKELPGLTKSNLQILLHPNTAKALTCLYYATFGQPRAIEMMIKAVKYTLDEMEYVYWSSNTNSRRIDRSITQAQLRQKLGESVKQLYSEVDKVYPETSYDNRMRRLLDNANSQDRPHIKKAIELLDLKAALCLNQNINEPIPHLGVTPKELEEKAYLIQWKKISETEKCYTRLFLLDYYGNIEKPLLTYQSETSLYWTPLDISLSTLILPDNIASFFDDGLASHTSFEHVTAASLYARYVLSKQNKDDGNIQFADILGVSRESLSGSLQEGTVNWKGVVVLHEGTGLTSQAVLDDIWQKQVIAIDRKAYFAEIIVPVTMEQKSAWIGIQTTKREHTGNVLYVDKCYEVVELRPSCLYNYTVSLGSLPSRAIVSPIFASYFEFAPIFNDYNLAIKEPVDN